MATGERSKQLTNRQIGRLAAAISANDMASIAEGFMDIPHVTVKNIRHDTSDSEAFNREIFHRWKNQNPDDQVKNLTNLLCRAAKDHGYLDPNTVLEILTETKEETSTSKTTSRMKSKRNVRVNQKNKDKFIRDLRLYMAQSMKMEPAPWIRDYVVDMEELYTELILEKIDKKLFKEQRIELENYKELFPLYDSEKVLKYLNVMYYLPGTKILIKGNPGMGKTSLVKKISWDWAKRQFVQVSIVFFVYLKLVKPGDAIENAIIQQTPPLERRGYTKEKITKILQYFGQDCLLILDGFDECAYGQNDEVHTIVRGSKFCNCNILLTSRPHSTREIERYFNTVVSVEGFTRSQAREFAGFILSEEEKVKVVLNFNPAGERARRPVHNVPILLSFLCLLVMEDPGMDLSDKTISMGEIYFRMVQCLYKKFTLRKGIPFKRSSFVTVLMSLGKLALETLLSGNPLLERSKIIEQVGEDVFEYGLLIGEDGFSLTRDMTVDILVTFPHRSLQEFLGAFFFVLSLGIKQDVNDVDEATREYLKTPLFSEFCLWLLDESNDFFSFPERSVAHEQLSSYVAEQIDTVKVEFQKLERNYPALSLAVGDNRNEMALKILEGALVKCSRIKHIVIEPHHPIDRILGSIPPVKFRRLNCIEISTFQEEKRQMLLMPRESPLQFLCVWHDQSFNLMVKWNHAEESVNVLNTVLKVCQDWNKSVYLRVSMPSICQHIQTFSIDRKSSQYILQDFPSAHTFSIDSTSIHYTLPMFKTYEQLINLFFTDCGLDSRDMFHLAEASAEGRLPKLSTLDISDNPDIGGNLSVLLSHCFPSLHTLLLSGCALQITDIHSLSLARREARLPQLRHLDVSFSYGLSFAWGSHPDRCLLPLLFHQGIPTLNTLVVQSCLLMPDKLYKPCPQVVENSKFLSKLTTLDMSRNETIGGTLSSLVCHCFPHLQIIVLRFCQLISDDLISLAQANSQGRLPELRHLDLSQNDIGGKKRGLFKLFAEFHGFPFLINIMLCACSLGLQDLCCLTQARLDGKLPKIRHLDISLNGLSSHVGILSRDPITQGEITWGKVVCYDD